VSDLLKRLELASCHPVHGGDVMEAIDRIAALEAENNELQAWVDGYREHGTRVLNANKEEIDTLKAKLDELQTAINTACNTIKRQPLDRVPSCLMELWDE